MIKGESKNTLPTGWEEFYDDDGTPYYVNDVTGRTSWNKPSHGYEQHGQL